MHDPAYRRIVDDFDLAPWNIGGEAYRQYAVAQYDREKQMLDEIGFKPE